MKERIGKLSLGLISGLLLAQTATAATYSGIHPLQSDPFVLSIGSFWANINSGADLAKKGTASNGRDIDFENDLNFDNTDTLPAFLLNWRISNRSRISAEYLTVGQGNSGKANRTLNWDGVQYEAGVKVKTNLDLDVGRLFYGYSLIKDDNKEFGLGLGLHYLSIDSAISGEASVNGVPVGRQKHGFDDWAILPNLGVYGNYAFSSKWLVKARVDWISANIGDYNGALWNTEAAIQYQALDNVGVGLSYRYLSFDIEANKSNKSWAIDLDYSGPLLFVTVNF